jgi:hypothetical protein
VDASTFSKAAPRTTTCVDTWSCRCGQAWKTAEPKESKTRNFIMPKSTWGMGEEGEGGSAWHDCRAQGGTVMHRSWQMSNLVYHMP